MNESVNNPFSQTYSDNNDAVLIKHALIGSKDALEQLIIKHQQWIYNIAFRMVANHEDANDISQEIVIKLITNLSSYDASKAAFRTWAYRIIVNHVLNMKRREYEKAHSSLEHFYSFVDRIPDEDPMIAPDMGIIVQDTMIGCVLGALMCLERTQRIVFILGVVFDVTSKQGAEILNVSRENFRKILSRSRKKLYSFMNNKCGLINENAPCQCRNKINEFIRQGWHSRDNLQFYKESVSMVSDMITYKISRFNHSIYYEFIRLFQSHPFYESSNMIEWIRETIHGKEFQSIFDLDENKVEG